MRTIKALLLLFLLYAPILHAQFEGIITLQVRSYSETETTKVAYTMTVKNDMLAIVTAGGAEAQKGNLIIRGDKKLMWIIDDDSKRYVEFPLIDDSTAAAAKHPATPKDPASQLKPTGKTKKVLGYPCEEYVGSMNGETSSIWASKKLGKVYDGLFKSLNQMSRMDEPGGSANDWQEQLVKMKLFPLSITTRRGGEIAETQDVVSIATKSTPAAAFEPPPGYAKQSMQNEFQQMLEQMKEKMKSEGGEKSDTSGG